MIKITQTIFLDEAECVYTFTRSSGPGGQNVNKVATAVILRFNARHSPSLPDNVRRRFLMLAGNKITLQGEVVIKANSYRTQERNKQDALNRLISLLKQAAVLPKKRKKTKPTFQSVERRLTDKKRRSVNKSFRQKKINTRD